VQKGDHVFDFAINPSIQYNSPDPSHDTSANPIYFGVNAEDSGPSPLQRFQMDHVELVPKPSLLEENPGKMQMIERPWTADYETRYKAGLPDQHPSNPLQLDPNNLGWLNFRQQFPLPDSTDVSAIRLIKVDINAGARANGSQGCCLVKVWVALDQNDQTGEARSIDGGSEHFAVVSPGHHTLYYVISDAPSRPFRSGAEHVNADIGVSSENDMITFQVEKVQIYVPLKGQSQLTPLPQPAPHADPAAARGEHLPLRGAA
jgi:hypothetical protein